MCVKFQLKTIYALDVAVYDMPVNTVVGIDAEGNWYRFGFGGADGVGEDPVLRASNCWPPARNNGVTLFRDFWRYISTSKGSPYMNAFLTCPKTKIKGA